MIGMEVGPAVVWAICVACAVAMALGFDRLFRRLAPQPAVAGRTVVGKLTGPVLIPVPSTIEKRSFALGGVTLYTTTVSDSGELFGAAVEVHS